jgi:hypothetical protein
MNIRLPHIRVFVLWAVLLLAWPATAQAETYGLRLASLADSALLSLETVPMTVLAGDLFAAPRIPVSGPGLPRMLPNWMQVYMTLEEVLHPVSGRTIFESMSLTDDIPVARHTDRRLLHGGLRTQVTLRLFRF